MSEFTKDVLKISTRTKGKNTWKVLTTKAEDGKEREENIIISGDRELQEKVSSVFDGPGKYQIEYEKRDDYWVPVGARKIGGTLSVQTNNTDSISETKPQISLAGIEIAKVGLESASMLVGDMVQAGLFKDASVDTVVQFTLEAFDSFAKKAKEFVQG